MSRLQAGFRGLAGGTAIIASWPIQPYPQELPEAVSLSSRLCSGICNVGFGLHIYVAVVYGPTKHHSHENPWGLLNELMQVAAQRAANFSCPALIVGDFNAEIDELPHWPMLQHMGWQDLADFSCRIHGGAPQPTSWNSNGVARRSFLLGNPTLAGAMLQGGTSKHHVFAAHPVLETHLDFDALVMDRLVWNLPRCLQTC